MKTSESNLTLSVVIPTIGEKELVNTIESLRNSTYKPHEIIVVVPKAFVFRLKELKIANITVLETDFAGQVQQRIAGFKIAKGDLVLQLDSDITLSKNCIEKLVKIIINKGDNVVVAPSYAVDEVSNIQHTGKLKKLLKIFINFGQGSIKSLEDSFTWDAWYHNFEWPKQLSQMNYINGGCLLHWKKNLVLEDYYPYRGKAYGEDLLHSFLLTKKGLRILCEPTAKVSTYIDSYEFSRFKPFFDFIRKTYAYKLRLVKISDGSFFRFHIWFSLFLINQLVIFLRNFSKNSI